MCPPPPIVPLRTEPSLPPAYVLLPRLGTHWLSMAVDWMKFTFPSKSKAFHKQEELQNGDRGGRETQCGWELLLPHVLFTFHSQSTVCKAEAWALPLVYQETEEAARKEQQKSYMSFNIRNFWSSLLLVAENHWPDHKYKGYKLRRRCHVFKRR